MRLTLDCRPVQVYNLQRERACEDDSQQAAHVLQKIKPESVGQYLIDCPEGTLSQKAATAVLWLDALPNVPHELFNGVKLYFEQISEFFAKLKLDLAAKIENLNLIGS